MASLPAPQPLSLSAHLPQAALRDQSHCRSGSTEPRPCPGPGSQFRKCNLSLQHQELEASRVPPALLLHLTMSEPFSSFSSEASFEPTWQETGLPGLPGEAPRPQGLLFVLRKWQEHFCFCQSGEHSSSPVHVCSLPCCSVEQAGFAV